MQDVEFSAKNFSGTTVALCQLLLEHPFTLRDATIRARVFRSGVLSPATSLYTSIERLLSRLVSSAGSRPGVLSSFPCVCYF